MVSRPPAPSSLDALVAAQQAQLRALRDILGEMQYMRREITALRRITAGPYNTQLWTPAGQAITVPLSLAAGASQVIIPPIPGPGGLISGLLTVSAIGDATTGIVLQPQYDGVITDIPVTTLVQGQVNSVLGLGLTQVNPQDGVVTVIFAEPWKGFSFYRSFQLSVINTFSGAISILNWDILTVSRGPIANWDEITEPEHNTPALDGSPLDRVLKGLTGS